MRFLHLADLHIGKRVNEFSMIEDQRYILNQILDIVKEQEVQCVLIAGDIYDKAVPSAEAVLLLDQFISRLAEMNVKVVAISGNHDSPERIGFGAEIMSTSGVYMSHPFNGNVEKVTLEDECGPINIYMLPFIKPAVVRPFSKKRMFQAMIGLWRLLLIVFQLIRMRGMFFWSISLLKVEVFVSQKKCQ